MSFLKDYLYYNEGNECARDYILWAGYAALSVAIGPKVYFDCEHFRVKCNIYVCLVGPAGNRKTFARDNSFDMLKETLPDVVVSAECETKQGITAFMGKPEQRRVYKDAMGVETEYRPFGLFASELMNYLALDPAGMITFLTDIYDRKFYQYRLKAEEHVLFNPYFVMLACTVPDWLTRQIKGDEFCSGFGRRTIFVCDDSDIRRRPSLSPDQRAAYLRCCDRLRQLSTIVGTFQFTPEAEDWFWVKWYPNLKHPDDKFLRSWSRSKHIQLLKVAMLTSLSERDDLIITIDYLHLALELLDHVLGNMSMITTRMGRSELVEPAATILSILRNHGGVIIEKDLRLATFKDFRNYMEYQQVLDYLKTTDQLVCDNATLKGKVVRALFTPEQYAKLRIETQKK